MNKNFKNDLVAQQKFFNIKKGDEINDSIFMSWTLTGYGCRVKEINSNKKKTINIKKINIMKTMENINCGKLLVSHKVYYQCLFSKKWGKEVLREISYQYNIESSLLVPSFNNNLYNQELVTLFKLIHKNRTITKLRALLYFIHLLKYFMSPHCEELHKYLTMMCN